MKHTPGKWTVETDQISLGNNMYDIDMWIESEKKDVICSIFTNIDEYEANAKHIVQMHNSFDKLLEALKSVERDYSFANDNMIDGLPNDQKELWETVKSAIAEAENQS